MPGPWPLTVDGKTSRVTVNGSQQRHRRAGARPRDRRRRNSTKFIAFEVGSTCVSTGGTAAGRDSRSRCRWRVVRQLPWWKRRRRSAAPRCRCRANPRGDHHRRWRRVHPHGGGRRLEQVIALAGEIVSRSGFDATARGTTLLVAGARNSPSRRASASSMRCRRPMAARWSSAARRSPRASADRDHRPRHERAPTRDPRDHRAGGRSPRRWPRASTRR